MQWRNSGDNVKRSYIKRSNKPLQSKSSIKRTRMSRKPKQGKRALSAQADAMVQAICVGRNRKCQVCGQRKATEGHHIIRRKYRALRWKVRYVIDVCHLCHDKDGQKGFNRACIKWLGGQRVYERLKRHAENAQPQHPQDAVDELKKVLDRQGRSDVYLGRTS
jgi:hypothetical protein